MTTKIIDTAKVLAVNTGAIVVTNSPAQEFMNFTAEDVQLTLSIISISLAICYTTWKWIRDYKTKK